MNISSAITKSYENGRLRSTEKTKPISPGLKRQLYRIYSSTHLLVNPSAPGRRCTVVLRGPGARRVTQQIPKRAAQKYLCTAIYATVPPPPPATPISAPPSTPLYRPSFHTFQPILQTYASAVPPLFVSFTQLCHTFSHFVERFQTPHPHFSPKNQGCPILRHRTTSHNSRTTKFPLTPYQQTRYETQTRVPNRIGDEGNRTLISAMRPRCAPVTPRPLSNYKPIT